MRVISVRNVNQAYIIGMTLLDKYGVERESRAGMVLEYPGLVVTEYKNPRERVLFNELRNANPFFHLMESLWMLSGRRDLQWIEFFNKRMSEFSDDGKELSGAYGYRWRSTFHYDQISRIIELLRADETDRRCVLQMWDAYDDLPDYYRAKIHGDRPIPKDLPCNTNVYFKIRDNKLDMTVCNRSNDIIWGAYGANVVHMSILQEYMAGMIGVDIGVYWQVSDSFHAYQDVWEEKYWTTRPEMECPYTTNDVKPYPLVDSPETWDNDLIAFMNNQRPPVYEYTNMFFPLVALRMARAWSLRKIKRYEDSRALMTTIMASDWKMACLGWVDRRSAK